jgi:hypothetical protein
MYITNIIVISAKLMLEYYYLDIVILKMMIYNVLVYFYI